MKSRLSAVEPERPAQRLNQFKLEPLPRQGFIDRLDVLIKLLEQDPGEALRRFIQETVNMPPQYREDWSDIAATLSYFEAPIALAKLKLKLARFIKEDQKAEALDAMDASCYRSFFERLAIEHGPRLSALVYSVTFCSMRRRKGVKRNAKKIGEAIGIGEHQAQKLIREALDLKLIHGKVVTHGWLLTVDDSWRRKLAAGGHLYYDLGLAKKLKSINAAIALSIIDPGPGDDWEEDSMSAPEPAWMGIWSAARLARALPWLSENSARKVLNRLVKAEYLERKKSGSNESVYDFELARSRWEKKEAK